MACAPEARRTTDKGLEYDDILCPYFHEFSQNYDCSLVYEKADSRGVGKSMKKYWISLDKCDVPAKVDESDEDYKLAFEYTLKYFDSIFKKKFSLHHEMSVNMPSSPGLEYTVHGILSKGEAMQSTIYSKNMADNEHIPISSTAVKKEFLSREDFEREKIRTVFLSPVDEVIKQKMLFDIQNEELLEKCNTNWIKYGFTKQYGGFNNLMKQFERFLILFEGDISGYDRTAFLKPVYQIRRHYLYKNGYPQETFFLTFLNRVVENLIRPCVAFPDGIIYERQVGNCSGTNNTCADNSILHVLVKFREAIKLFRECNKEISYSKIMFCVLHALYSDDCLSGYDLDIDKKTFLDLIVKNYEFFGFTLKKSAVFISQGPGIINEKHSFLGSFVRFSDYYKMYVPYPRLGKICSALIRTVELKTLTDLFDKTLAFIVLTYNTELYELVRSFMIFLIERYVHLLDPGKRQFVEEVYNDVGFHSYWESICIGREGGLDLKINMSDTSRRLHRAEQIFNSLIAGREILPSSYPWLKCAIDPFMDVPLQRLEGYPDKTSQNTIVKMVTKSKTFTKPAALPAGNWNLMLYDFNIPGSFKAGVRPFYPPNVIDPQIGGVTFTWGGLTAFASTANNDFAPTDAFDQIVLDNNDVESDQEFRVIGSGFEVVNATAPLYKSGTITNFRIPNEPSENSSVYWVQNVPINTAWGVMEGCNLGPVPRNTADVMKYPSTVQWEAEKGCYAVNSMNSCDNYFQDRKTKSFTMKPYIPPAPPSSIITSEFVVDANNIVSPTMIWPVGQWNSNGCILSGISDQSSITVKKRWYIEIAPDQESQLVSLSTPSSPFDPGALEICARVFNQLPVATIEDGNNLGTWLANAADVVSSFFELPPLGTIASNILSFDPMPKKSKVKGKKKVTREKKKINKEKMEYNKKMKQANKLRREIASEKRDLARMQLERERRRIGPSSGPQKK